jgi:hypothetical protein
MMSKLVPVLIQTAVRHTRLLDHTGSQGAMILPGCVVGGGYHHRTRQAGALDFVQRSKA